MNESMEHVEKQIEISIEAARGAVQRRDKLKRLIETKDFEEIFTEGYFKEEAARLVGLLTDPEFKDKESREDIINDMIGISATRQYLMNVLRLGDQMERQIMSAERELEELRAEESTEED